MRVIIHAGLNKTGSTSIQNALAIWRNRLSEQGFFYPQLDNERFPGHWVLSAFWHEWMDPQTAGHLLKRLARMGGIEKVMDAVQRRLLRCLQQAASHPRGVVLLSDEHLGYPNAVIGARRLSALIERHGGEVTVLAYARPDPALFVSMVQQQLKSVTLKLDSRVVFHSESVRALQQGFGTERVAVRIFERDCLVKSDVVEDFCDWIARLAGRPMPNLGEVPRVNESISAPGCALLLRLRDCSDPVRDDLAYSHVRKVLMESLDSLPAPRLTLPEGWERRITSLAHPSWNRIVDLSDHPEHVRARVRMPVAAPERTISTDEVRNWIEGQWDRDFNASLRAHLAARPERWVSRALDFLDLHLTA